MYSTSTTAIAALLLFSTLTISVSAGPHSGVGRRRHHGKRLAARIEQEVRELSEDFDKRGGFVMIRSSEKRDTCEQGAWKCVGSELMRCNWNEWLSIQNCTGDNIICSSDSRATGCIWTWSLDDVNEDPVTAVPIPSAATTIVVPSTRVATSAGPKTTAATNGSDDGVAPHNQPDNATQSSGVACSTSTTSASYPPAAASPDVVASSTSAPVSLSPSPSPTASVIGGALLAGNHSGDNADSTSQSSSSSKGRKHKSTSTQDWYSASTQDGSAVSSTGAWSATSATKSRAVSASSSSSASSAVWSQSTSQDWYHGAQTPHVTTTSAWAAATSSAYDNGQWSSSSTRHGKGQASSTYSSAFPQASSGGNSTGPSGPYTAPHYVIYADDWLSTMPGADQISSYNRFILAFWMSDAGAVDDAQAWEQFNPSYRQQVLDEYHAAGIALMVSAFGSTDAPTTNNVDPTQCAQQLAAWVKQYGLDGVDIDYEDMNAMNANYAEPWIITFQQELRQQLPAPYLISHAPVAPWFTSGSNYPSGAYVAINQQVGSGIDFYNVQFYNQGNSVYEDCDSLINDSGSEWPDTSVMGINKHAGVPLDKIVIGKPIDAGAASNGFLDGTTLASCVSLAKQQGWNAGVMFWEWEPLIGNSFMATVRG